MIKANDEVLTLANSTDVCPGYRSCSAFELLPAFTRLLYVRTRVEKFNKNRQ